MSDSQLKDKSFTPTQQKAANFYRALQNANCGFWTIFVNDDGPMVRFDETACLILGTTENLFQWDNFLTLFIHPDDTRTLAQRLEECYDGKFLSVTESFLCHNLEHDSWLQARLTGGLWVTEDGDQREVCLILQILDTNEELRLTRTECNLSLGQEKQRALTEIRNELKAISSTLGLEANLERRMVSSRREGFLHSAENFVPDVLGVFKFITEQMWWYKSIIDNIPFPVFITDTDKNYSYMNEPATNFMWISGRDEDIGSPYLQWGVDANGNPGSGLGYLEEGKNSFVLFNPSIQRYFQGHASYLFDQQGNQTGHLETIYDITEVHEADERLRIMLDSTPLCCNFWDMDFNNIDCNEAAAKLFELKSKQEYLDRFFELSPEFQPDGRPSAEVATEHITRAFAEGREQFEWMHQLLDGTPIPSEITLVRVEHGDTYIVVGYTKDLRELKAKQSALDKERVLLKKILDNSPICFLILVNGAIAFVAPYAQEFLGISTTSSLDDFFAEEQEKQDFFDSITSAGNVAWRVIAVKTADGSVKEMLTNAFTAEYYEEPCIMAWFMDISEMREKEREILLAKEVAEESARAKSDFLANMSHEIRTPMNAILGMTNLVLNTELNARQRDYLEKSEHSARALLRILNDILDFSKIEAGKMEMEEVPFGTEDILRRATDIILPKTVEKQLELFLDISPELPMTLVGDPLRLHQVLINLLSNAVKFTNEGDITLRVSLLEADAHSALISFEVADTGIGLTQAQADKLFSPFTQADTSTTRRYGGTGLGLAICKNLVGMMGGEIGCRPNEGNGSIFHFSARFRREDAKTLHANIGTELSGLNVLAVDDRLNALARMEEILRALGCKPHMASSAAEAELVLQDAPRPFDLMLLDWNLPEEEKQAVCNLAQRLQKTKKTLALSAEYWSDETLKAVQALGVTGALIKPLTINSTYAAIMGIMRGTSAEKQNKNTHKNNMVEEDKLRGLEVLLAEDNEINQIVASEMLALAQVKVTIANNGFEVIKLLQKYPFDLVLMDIQMPEMDGITATARLRKDPRFAKLPIIAMTAHAMVGDREKSLEAGMNDHITKPVEQEELFKTIAKWAPERRRAAEDAPAPEARQTEKADLNHLAGRLQELMTHMQGRRVLRAKEILADLRKADLPQDIMDSLQELTDVIALYKFHEAIHLTEALMQRCAAE